MRWNRLGWTCLACLVGLGLGSCSRSPDEAAEDGSSEPAPEPATAAVDQSAAASDEPFDVEDGFRLLTLDDFAIYPATEAGAEQTWATSNGTIECSGKPRGYAYTKERFANFTLRLEVRFPGREALANTGVLIYVSGEHKLWPKCLEVQGKYPEMAAIKSNSRDVTIEVQDNESARRSARKPAGDWNRLEVISRGGALTSILNGELICVSQASSISDGALGIQSEGFRVQFRRIRIRVEELSEEANR